MKFKLNNQIKFNIVYYLVYQLYKVKSSSSIVVVSVKSKEKNQNNFMNNKKS